jgi:hypothetical protein
MAEIFLSYRRRDSQSATGRLADDLEAHFGDDRVFRDHEIGAGDDFVAAIRRSVESSTVVLAVVGPRWLAMTDDQGRRRLDDPDDFVRLEIELALAARVAVVPVLVEGATMPAAAELPPSIAAFARCQAVELSDKRWRFDVDTLIESLQARFGIDAARDAAPAVAVASAGTWTRRAADFADLALHPRRLIARRQTGSARDVAAAFAFLCLTIVAGNALLLTAIDVDLVARGSPAEVALGVGAWLLTALVVGLLVAALLVAALALAWRVVARTAVARTVAVVAAYVCGGAWLGICAGAAFVVVAVQLVEPGALRSTLAALKAAAAASTPLAPPSLGGLDGGPLRSLASVLMVVGAVVWLATAAWCVAAWGAFRQSLAASRTQALLATTLWIALLAALFWLPARLV